MKKFLAFLGMLLIGAGAYAQEASVKFDPYVSLRAFYGYHGMSIPSDVETLYADNETDMAYRLQTNSRFGTNFAAGKVKGVVEFGLDSTLSLRLAYGIYDFGGVQLEVGQDYTPYTWLANADYADDNNLTGFGASYDGRKPQIKIMASGLYVALIAPNTNKSGVTGYTAKDTTVLIPKTAIGYDFKAEGVTFGLGGAYNAYKLNDSSMTTPNELDGEKVTSYLAYVHGDFTFGMIQLKANFAYGQNAGDFGIKNVPDNSDSVAKDDDFAKTASTAYNESGTIKNSKHMEGYVNLVFKLSPDFQIGGAVGYQSDKLDIDGAKADTQMIYAVDAKYAVDKNLAFYPTFSYRDYAKDSSDNDQPSEYYAGVKIQFDVK